MGRIYQQTFIDTYSKVGWAKLYDRKTPVTSSGPLVLQQNTEPDVQRQCAVGEGENVSSVNSVRTHCLSDKVLTFTLSEHDVAAGKLDALAAKALRPCGWEVHQALNHHATPDFWACYHTLSTEIQLADRAHDLPQA